MLRLSFTILLALCLVSCGDRKKQSAENPVEEIPAMNLAQAKEIAQNASMVCADPSDCPLAVGMLTGATTEGAYQCTASLVSEDIAITNSHCIPNDLKIPSSDCRDRIWITFDPGHPEFETRLGCDSVIFASEEDSNISTPDYAYIRLAKKSLRPPLKISRAGFQDGELYQLHKVNPVKEPGLAKGSLQTVNCKAIYHSAITDFFNNPYSSVAMVADCFVIKGNSGGPLLAADGTLRGVVSSILKKTEYIKEAGLANTKETDLADMNMVANLACLATYDDIWQKNLPKDCKNLERFAESEKKQAESIRFKTLKKLIDESMLAQNENPVVRSIRWNFLSSKKNESGGLSPDSKLIGAPECVKKTIGKTTSQEIKRPIWKFTEKLDAYLRTIIVLEQVSAAKDTLSIAKDEESYKVRLVGENPAYSATIKRCK